MKQKILASIIGFIALTITGQTMAGSILDNVKNKGFVQCGVSVGLSGFSSLDFRGNWVGLDVDICRAVAAALFGNAKKVKYSALEAKDRFTALQSGAVDVLSRNTTWTASRDTSLGINFAGVNYYDGQGFLVKKSLGVTSAKDLNGAYVCMPAAGVSTTELNLMDYFKIHNIKYKAVHYKDAEATLIGFKAGRCDILSSDQSQLFSLRSELKKPESAIILPEIISKEPLGPVVAEGDDEWFNLVRWSLFAMINAEELGVSSKNIAEKMKSNDPAVRRLLGLEGKFGENLKVSNRWAHDIIAQVGNYGESFARNLGQGSPLKLPRGLNELWSQGGIMYAPPIR